MKIRLGFVSNSSSSSFLVSFENEPKNKDEMAKLLFGKDYLDQLYVDPYNEESWPCCDVASIVWNDFKDKKPLSMGEMVEVVVCGYFDGKPDYPHGIGFDNDKIEEYHKECDLAAKGFLNNFIKRLPNKYNIYSFNYSDNDSSLGSAMEHGYLFRRLKHLGISYH